MPVFHTKTIESILEPVAQQVSRLVILHEEAEDGNAMPDLEKPVFGVSRAVQNLVKVGRETIQSSDDAILRQDMPAALQRVEQAARHLEEASGMLKADPFSQPARKKLIEGSRGILQGTSSLLLCFDESEVRKIISECKRVLDYLAVAEVVDSLEDLVRFVKDLSPCLSKVSREVDGRQKELTHQVHRDILIRCLEEVKTLTPILICSMKIYIQIHAQGGKGGEEAGMNRDYLAQRMTDELNEIIRVLQLTTYDEDEWDADNLTGMKRQLQVIDSKMTAAYDWLRDPRALRGGVGEKSVRGILDAAMKVSDRCLPQDRDPIRKMTGDIYSMTDGLCELRSAGQGDSPQAESLAKGIEQKLAELNGLVLRAVTNAERSGILQPAHTVTGRLEQARKWLGNPAVDDRGLGQRAISLIVDEARRVADGLPGVQKAELLNLSDQVDSLLHQLGELCRRGEGNSPAGQAIAGQLVAKLAELKNKIQTAVINRVVEDFVDTVTPLRQFTEAVLAPEGSPGRDQNFVERATALQNYSGRASKTARMVAAGGAGDNKKLAEALLFGASQVESLTPQLINAGRIRMAYPDNGAANEHFENLKTQYADSIAKVRDLCDEAIDSGHFIQQSEEAIKKHTVLCEDAIRSKQPPKMVDNTSSIARLANRVLMVARQEADNSEDANFIRNVSHAADQLQSTLPPMVQSAKSVAISMSDPSAASRWRDTNNDLLSSVGLVRKAVTVHELPLPPPPPLPDMSSLYVSPPSRPPPPAGMMSNYATTSGPPPPRPPPPETDDEDDMALMFNTTPTPNQPIMMAAHSLHHVVGQWSSKDNEIVASAKRMALLMARLSQLVRGEGGTKKDLIACAKEIAEASEEVTRLAKELSRDCTDKRMRTSLLQVCERIPTIGTQLKILSTVKATMLGAQGTEEDREATEMLVGNAQNLMQSVKETVRAAEAASIKMRTDAGVRMRWVRKQPWYHY
ncbi:vinculin isoform X3 [Folsomia candida]|uniref:vinculin isoform X3 n=1 Tax=Folsomia candida TaxID=158441 RepID=UPI000B900AD6|nr:vinculin isoform X3 [Folsomia candida]